MVKTMLKRGRSMPGKRKRKRTSPHLPIKGNSRAHGFYTPFIDLDQQLTKPSPPEMSKPAPPAGRKTTACGEPGPQQEDFYFFEAMSGVKPLDRKGPQRIPPPPPTHSPPRFLYLEELEVYNELLRLVEGESDFELSFSDEYIDGAVLGLSPRVLKKLRHGEFSYQKYQDLHRMTRPEAREAVTRFILDSFAEGCRCVLVVSGRGLNSLDKEPVIKHSLVNWLTQAPLKRIVLAFASARSYDGGAGAFYVLLRRNHGKVAFRVSAR
jgi:DNA-nicking Smr family endonuclease